MKNKISGRSVSERNMEITITVTYGQIILIFLLTFSGLIVGKGIFKYLDRPPERRLFMNPHREDITDEKIKSEVKTLGKMYRKMPQEQRKLIAYVLELLKRDLHNELRIIAEERKAEKDVRF